MDERFESDEPALLLIANNTTRNCIVKNISVGGARLECAAGWSGVTVGRLEFLADGVNVGFRIVDNRNGKLIVRFDKDTSTRRLITAKLFTGGYHNEIQHVSPWNVVRSTAIAMIS